jgi:hypothetical protein
MATTTTNFGWDIPQSTDLVKDGATAIAALGQDIDTALIDLKGGTTGQVLAKASGTDLDFSWVAVDPLTILDAKGDLISATAADTPSRLAVGTNGQVLTADSSTATGLKWADAGGGGKVLQVVYAGYSTAVTSSTTAWVDTGLTATITPSSSTSKILVLGTINGVIKVGTNTSAQIQWLRGATQIARPSDYAAFTGDTSTNDIGSVSINYLDSPATTSATTYKAQFNSFNNSSYVQVQDNNVLSTLVLMEIGA